jgi:hypothetical protein
MIASHTLKFTEPQPSRTSAHARPENPELLSELAELRLKARRRRERLNAGDMRRVCSRELAT